MKNSLSKKVLAFAALFFLSLGIGQAQDNRPGDNQPNTETVADFKIENLEQLPSIILVNKNLEVLAQFYGKHEEVKQKFEGTFKSAYRLAEHNGQRIYLLSVR